MSQGQSNGRGSGNGGGPPEHVEERSNGAVHVGKSERERCKERATCDDQQDRIEAKLDLLLDELGVDY
jgi:hypothetical protein